MTPQRPSLHGIPDQSLAPASSAAAKTDRLVLEYLRKRGFKNAEHALTADLSNTPQSLDVSAISIEDAEVDDDLRNVILMLKRPSELAVSDVRRFDDCYCELRDWVDGSLDIYKSELHSILYPLFVHCFLEMVRREQPDQALAFMTRCATEFSEATTPEGSAVRKQELVALSSVSTPQHLEENQVANLFLSHRYEIHLSYYAFELIVSFLADDPRRAVLLRILNQRCRIRIDDTNDESIRVGGFKRADSSAKSANASAFIPSAERDALLRSDVLWGRLRPEHYMIPDQDVDLNKPNKAALEKPKTADLKKPDSSSKKEKDNDKDDEPSTQEDGTISASKIPLKRYRYGAAGLETALDLKNRANLRGQLSPHSSKEELSALFYTFTNSREEGINCAAISEDGSQVAAGCGDSSVRVWDAKRTGTAGSGEASNASGALRLIGHSGPVFSVDWTRCARFVLSGSEDGTVRLWSTQMKTDLVSYQGHNYPIWSTAFSPLDHYFASGSHDRTARIWSTDRIYPLRILAGHLADVDVVTWHPNCNYLATGSSDRTARLWDVREGKCVRLFSGHGGTIHSLAFSPDGRTLACGGDGATIDIWDIANGKRVKRLAGHKSTVWSMDYSREGALLASGGADQQICVWRATDWCKIVEDIKEDDTNGNQAESNTAANGSSSEPNGVGADGDVEMSDGTNDANAKPQDNVKDDGTKHGKNATQLDQQDRAAEGEPPPTVQGGRSLSPLIDTFCTKETPVYSVLFSRRNVLLGTGTFGV